MKTYTCDLCGKVFNRKDSYNKHKARKIPCNEEKQKIDIKTELTQLQQKVYLFERMSKITTDKDIQDLFENIHHLLWSREGFSPEKAMEHLNFMFYLKCIEPQIDAGNITLPQCCKFSYLVSITDEHKLFGIFKSQVLPAIYKNDVTKDYFARIEIRYPDTLIKLIGHINRIDMNMDKDFLGSIYEHIIGRGMTTMSDDGQYFTARPICKYAVDLARQITPIEDNGKIASMIDPFCGTGGFITEYVKSIHCGFKKDDMYSKNIRDFWEQQKGSIYGNDIKISSVMSTLLNLMFTTGVSFERKCMVYKNAFYDSLFPQKKFKFILTNPPFGGDKDKGDDFKFKYGYYPKGKTRSAANYTHNVSDEIKRIGVKIDDKMTTAVQLCMSILDKNGTCGIVLPEGFFFASGKQQVILRKKLIEEFNVRYVVDIPQDAFENTSTKTCLMIFSNDGPTKEIEFIDFINRTTEQKTLVKVKLDEIIEKGYSLSYKRYLKQEWKLEEGYKMVKLGDIIEYPSKKNKYKASDGYTKGKYRFFTSSQDRILYRDDFEFRDDYLIVGRGGNPSIHFANRFSVSHDDVYVIDLKQEFKSKISMKYIYYLLKSNIQIIENGFHGSTIKHNTKGYMNTIQIPLPSIKRQQEIVDNIDQYMVRAEKGKELVKVHEKCMMADVKRMYTVNKCEMMKLKDVAEIQFGKRIVKSKCETGEYPVYGGGGVTFYTNVYNRDGLNCKISRFGISEKECVRLIHGKFWCHDNGMTIKPKLYINDPYLYYFLISNSQLIMNYVTGTCQGALNTESFKENKIPIPPLSIQKQLEPDFEWLKMTKKQIDIWETKGKELIQQLSQIKPVESDEVDQVIKKVKDIVIDDDNEVIEEIQTAGQVSVSQVDEQKKQEILNGMKLIIERNNQISQLIAQFKQYTAQYPQLQGDQLWRQTEQLILQIEQVIQSINQYIKQVWTQVETGDYSQVPLYNQQMNQMFSWIKQGCNGYNSGTVKHEIGSQIITAIGALAL
jgi:type I restriction-modification system DNA methylase subunit